MYFKRVAVDENGPWKAVQTEAGFLTRHVFQ
jgi:hypothetical protein